MLRKIFHQVSRITSDFSYRRQKKNCRHRLPRLSPADARIVHALKNEGAFITSLRELSIPSTPLLFQASQELLPALSAITPNKSKKNYVIHASADEIMKNPALLLWGLEERLLNIVENYIEVPIVYRGLTFRRELADGQDVETRLWHKDDEDRQIFKIIVYLNDVDLQNGPFEFIPKHKSNKLNFIDRRLNDDEMARLVPKSDWVSCTGSAGTVVFADTCSIFHRGKTPESSERFALFYCYNSKKPRTPEYCSPLFSKDKLLHRVSTLAHRQKECLPS